MEITEKFISNLANTNFCVEIDWSFKNQAILVIEEALMEAFKAGVLQADQSEELTKLKDAYALTSDLLATTSIQRDNLLNVVKWIASQENLFFAECSQAEAIVSKCREALSNL